jgi:hypothetical protein
MLVAMSVEQSDYDLVDKKEQLKAFQKELLMVGPKENISVVKWVDWLVV